MTAPLRVFIGWDPREPEAYDVAAFSLQRRASRPVQVTPLRQDALRRAGVYRRPPDPLASTAFTYTRFLTPHLAGFEGLALYCDSDFLWLADVSELFELAAARDRAVWCVPHDHRPTETLKMDGVPQSAYPRKNWSSLMLFDCGHPSTRRLTPDVVNRETGAFLHRMQWAEDEEIGGLPTTWNWLEGWNTAPPDGPPSVVHFTRGGPWFDQWRDVAYADLWLDERARMEREPRSAQPTPPPPGA